MHRTMGVDVWRPAFMCAFCAFMTFFVVLGSAGSFGDALATHWAARKVQPPLSRFDYLGGPTHAFYLIWGQFWETFSRFCGVLPWSLGTSETIALVHETISFAI